MFGPSLSRSLCRFWCARRLVLYAYYCGCSRGVRRLLVASSHYCVLLCSDVTCAHTPPNSALIVQTFNIYCYHFQVFNLTLGACTKHIYAHVHKTQNTHKTLCETGKHCTRLKWRFQYVCVAVTIPPIALDSLERSARNIERNKYKNTDIIQTKPSAERVFWCVCSLAKARAVLRAAVCCAVVCPYLDLSPHSLSIYVLSGEHTRKFSEYV